MGINIKIYRQLRTNSTYFYFNIEERRNIMQNRIYRSRRDKVIGGVCGGLGEYFAIDPTIIRLIWAISVLSGFGFLAYIIAWIAIPERPVKIIKNPVVQNSLLTEEQIASDNAYYSEHEQNLEDEFGSDYEPANGTLTNNTSKVIGIALIVFGGSYIFRKFFGFINLDERLIFSGFLILAGLYMLTKKKD